jgi:hypothetical protein
MTIHLPGTPPSWLDNEIAKAEEDVFSFQHKEALKSGRYHFHVAARLIAQDAGILVSTSKLQARLISDARDKKLPVYQIGQSLRWDGEQKFTSVLEIFWDDLNKWLAVNEPRIEYEFPAPHTSNAAKPKTRRSITKGAVINAFADLHFTRDKWDRALSNLKKHPWLNHCFVDPAGPKGSRVSITWNPVLIACALHEKKIHIKKLDAVFDQSGLKDWADEWEESSALFRE